MQIVLDLPFPPSTNELWRVGVRTMYESMKYKTWKADAAVMFYQRFAAKKRPQPFDKFYVYIIIDSCRRSARMDSDNRIKAPLDFCQSAGLIKNDSRCEGGIWQWGHAPSGCVVS